jgi:hypothetical protein
MLRRQLAESRRHLARTSSGLGASLDVPARVRQTVAAHPVKWALLAVAGGVVAARLLPLATSVMRTAANRRLVGTLLATVGPVALRAGLNALATHRPDLAAFIHGKPDDAEAFDAHAPTNTPSDRPPPPGRRDRSV